MCHAPAVGGGGKREIHRRPGSSSVLSWSSCKSVISHSFPHSEIRRLNQIDIAVLMCCRQHPCHHPADDQRAHRWRNSDHLKGQSDPCVGPSGSSEVTPNDAVADAVWGTPCGTWGGPQRHRAVPGAQVRMLPTYSSRVWRKGHSASALLSMRSRRLRPWGAGASVSPHHRAQHARGHGPKACLGGSPEGGRLSGLLEHCCCAPPTQALRFATMRRLLRRHRKMQERQSRDP